VRKAAAGILIGLGAAGIILAADLLFDAFGRGTAVNPFHTIELKTYDWRLAHTAKSIGRPQRIALVGDRWSTRSEIIEPECRPLALASRRDAMLIDLPWRARPPRLWRTTVLFPSATPEPVFSLAVSDLGSRVGQDASPIPSRLQAM
jgi:hypothetical protein